MSYNDKYSSSLFWEPIGTHLNSVLGGNHSGNHCTCVDTIIEIISQPTHIHQCLVDDYFSKSE